MAPSDIGASDGGGHPDAVFFDFYGTLVHFGNYHREVTAAFLDALDLDGAEPDPDAFFDRWNEHFYALKDHLVEHDEFLPIWHMYGESMDRAFRDRGLDVSGDQIAAAVRICTEALPGYLTLAPGAEATVEALREAGRTLAVVSNADEDDLHRQLAQVGLDGRFDAVVSSEQAMAYKPHPRIFRIALDRVGLEPGQVAFVGDNPRWDIAGANRVGMTSVWYNHRGDPPVDGIEPRHEVRKLQEVAALFGSA